MNPQYWSEYFRGAFCDQINNFHQVFTSRVLPTFSNMEAEAQTAAEDEYQRLMNQPATGVDIDMGYLADKAQETGISTYRTLAGIRQTLTNLAVAALYHMLEQQLLLFYRKHLLQPAQENDIKLMDMKKVIEKLESTNIKITAFLSWTKLDELQCIANTVKHADGRSASKLRKLRPDIFEHPQLRNSGRWFSIGYPSVFMPLAGEDVYLTENDMELYRSSIVSFWSEFADIIVKTM